MNYSQAHVLFSLTNMNSLVSILMFCISIFGWHMAFRVRRPLVFRLKLFIVYSIPITLSLSFATPLFTFTNTYVILMLCTFIVLFQILYWREMKVVITRIGYHKQVLGSLLDVLPDMVWMKDTKNRYTYTNTAIRSCLLFCTEEEAFGKTWEELAEVQRVKGREYTFDTVCGSTDNITLDSKLPCRFLEFGVVNGNFIALQMFKSPLFIEDKNGKKKVVGTIGIGRDLTYDCIDHENIQELLDANDLEGAKELFMLHKERYMVDGNCAFSCRPNTNGV